MLKVQAMLARCGEHPDLEGEETAAEGEGAAAGESGEEESKDWLADPQ